MTQGLPAGNHMAVQMGFPLLLWLRPHFVNGSDEENQERNNRPGVQTLPRGGGITRGSCPSPLRGRRYEAPALPSALLPMARTHEEYSHGHVHQ
jgi:hypothetical protein